MRRDFNLNSKIGRAFAWIYAMIVEHNFINIFRLNFHKISDEAYRSAQPTMSQLEKYVKKYNIKTIINLKGRNPAGAYFLFEKEKCKELGINLVNVGIKSRGIPKPEQIKEAKDIFEKIEYPVWIHCKAGSDRTGIYAVLYKHFRKNTSIEQAAKKELSFWPYGHIKYSKAGKVDFYFNKFVQYQKENPNIDFFYWSQKIVDREKLEKEFKSSKFANFINDYILRRE